MNRFSFSSLADTTFQSLIYNKEELRDTKEERETTTDRTMLP